MSDHAEQKELFLTDEGDAWYLRNKAALSSRDVADDPVLNSIKSLSLMPKNILEIGCSNGWRLQALQASLHAKCSGIDPSAQAIAEGRAAFPDLNLQVGTADALPFNNGQFDMAIFGFCLYLCDRNDLFRIACEGDRVLADGGYIVIYDFCTPTPYRNEYSHRPGYYCYKMDYSELFAWNPLYSQVDHRILSHDKNPKTQNVDERIAVTILRKSLSTAYPDNPYTKTP